MILLDTHIWVWWVSRSSSLSPRKSKIIAEKESEGLGVSIISCWEVAKLVEKGRLAFSVPVAEWVEKALSQPGISLLPLDPKIVVGSTQLQQPFHNDPADQMIVATARELDLPLATDDGKILLYSHVRLVWRENFK